MTTKSCHNCKNCHSWYFSATREDPEDSSWQCKLELDDGDDPAGLNDAQLAEHFAKDCQSYEFQPELPEPPDDFIEPDPEYDIHADTVRLMGMGLLDRDGMPTDAFFEWV